MAAKKKKAKKKTTARRTPRTLARKKPRKKGAVRKRAAGLKWDPAQFLELLNGNGDVGRVCKALKIGRRTAYDYREKHPAFAEAWENATEEIVDAVESSMLEKARDGWTEPVFWQGKAVGVVRKFSPMLMRFVCESRRPERYNGRWRFTELMQSGGGDAAGSQLAQLVVDTAHAIDAMMPGGDEGNPATDDTITSE
jgi:hypothetical protein